MDSSRVTLEPLARHTEDLEANESLHGGKDELLMLDNVANTFVLTFGRCNWQKRRQSLWRFAPVTQIHKEIFKILTIYFYNAPKHKLTN